MFHSLATIIQYQIRRYQTLPIAALHKGQLQSSPFRVRHTKSHTQTHS